MGFGLLFIGYFITYFMTHLMSLFYLGAVVRLIGYVMMSVAFYELSGYSTGFKGVSYASLVMLIATVISAFAELTHGFFELGMLKSTIFPTELWLRVEAVTEILDFGFHALLLYAIFKIASEIEVHKIRIGAIRNFVFVSIYAVLRILSELPFEALGDFPKYLRAPSILLYFVLLIVNLVLIFTCYAKICDESDIDMPLKKSKIEFVNKIREETARREQKAADDSVEYAIQKLLQRREKRSKK